MAGNRTVRTDTLAETHVGVQLTMPGRQSLVQPKSLVTRSVLKRVDLHEYLPNIYIVYTIYILIYICVYTHTYDSVQDASWLMFTRQIAQLLTSEVKRRGSAHQCTRTSFWFHYLKTKHVTQRFHVGSC